MQLRSTFTFFFKDKQITCYYFFLICSILMKSIKPDSNRFYSISIILYGERARISPDSFRKEGRSVLFNDALNTFYLRLYGVRHMVKNHSDSEGGNPLPPHILLFPISSKGSFICIIPDKITHTTAFVTPVVEHWLEREIAQWVHPMKDRSDNPSHHERTLLPRSYISLPDSFRIYSFS